jgi:predicted GIY-YIG superfamily endonuclease
MTAAAVHIELADPLDVDGHGLPALSFTPSTHLDTACLEATRAAAEIGVDLGVVYLLHFDRPYRHASHYTGWTSNLDGRLADHAAGHGARLLAVIHDAGIGFTLARTWPGSRSRERALKRQGGASRRCPLCGITPRNHTRSGGTQ